MSGDVPSLAGGGTKAKLLFLLKLLLTVACLWWALSRVDWRGSVFSQPERLQPLWLLGSVALAGLAVLLGTVRWWIFILAQGISTCLGRVLRLTLIGNMFSMVALGGLGGSAARVMLLARDHPDGKLQAVTSVMVDQLGVFVAISLLFFACTPGYANSLAVHGALEQGVLRFAWCYFGGGLAMVVLLFVIASPPVTRLIHTPERKWRWPVLRRMPAVYDIYRKKWLHSLGGVAVAIITLLTYYLSFWCAVRGVGGGASSSAVVSAMPVIDGLSALPVSVAGVGVRENLFQVLLGQQAGMGNGTAVAASLAGFLCQLAWAPAGAWLFLKRRGPQPAPELADDMQAPPTNRHHGHAES